MTGNQTEEEIGCCWRQIVSGVRYLHEMGLAHRDLKLDNCVVNEFGIVKIIDFGCAVVFKYPLEQDQIEATGACSPVMNDTDRQESLEVIHISLLRFVRRSDITLDQPIYGLPQSFIGKFPSHCICDGSCMIMRRFPWKAPRMSDPSFRNFSSAPNPYVIASSPGTESGSHSSSLAVSRKSTLDSSSTLTPSQSGGKNLSVTTSGSSLKKEDTPPPAPINKGPMKLFNRLQPPQCRPLIGRMLDINPNTRITMEEIWTDPWFRSLKRCEMVEERTPVGGKMMVVKRAGRHDHVLVGPTGEDVTPSGSSVKRISEK